MVDIGVIFSIVPRVLPTFMLGLVALLGLLLQRKSLSEIIAGTIKTMAGVVILFVAVDVIVAAISPVATMFGQVYAVEGEATIDFTGFLGEFGIPIVSVMVFGFLINVLIARFTPWKYVFLTGHILFWNAFMITAALADSGELKGTALIVIGSIILGVISTLLPALIAPFVRELTGKSEFTIGHTTTGVAIVGALLGRWFGDKSRSTEDMEISGAFGFLKEMVISTSIVMFLIYLIMGVIAGPTWAAETFAGGSILVWIFWMGLQGLTFGGGLVVLLTGVRMMLAEIIPAFYGIAQRIVPNAVPALDCPMVFPYAPNALAIGFPIAVITSMIALAVFGAAGYKYVLLPLIVAAFFDVGPGAVLANATGGVRGVIIASAVGGVLIIAIQAVALPFVLNTAAGFVNAFGGNDFGLIAVVVGGLAKLLGF